MSWHFFQPLSDLFRLGLRLKYTNRSGESLAYSDEGYVDLTHVKNLSLIHSIVAYPEEVRVQAQRCFQVSNVIKLFFSSSSTVKQNKLDRLSMKRLCSLV
jgi:hypothetical protein